MTTIDAAEASGGHFEQKPKFAAVLRYLGVGDFCDDEWYLLGSCADVWSVADGLTQFCRSRRRLSARPGPRGTVGGRRHSSSWRSFDGKSVVRAAPPLAHTRGIIGVQSCGLLIGWRHRSGSAGGRAVRRASVGTRHERPESGLGGEIDSDSWGLLKNVDRSRARWSASQRRASSTSRFSQQKPR